MTTSAWIVLLAPLAGFLVIALTSKVLPWYPSIVMSLTGPARKSTRVVSASVRSSTLGPIGGSTGPCSVRHGSEYVPVGR